MRYIARDGTTMNYAKKSLHFYDYPYYFIRNTYHKMILNKIYTLCTFMFFIFGQHVGT